LDLHAAKDATAVVDRHRATRDVDARSGSGEGSCCQATEDEAAAGVLNERRATRHQDTRTGGSVDTTHSTSNEGLVRQVQRAVLELDTGTARAIGASGSTATTVTGGASAASAATLASGASTATGTTATPNGAIQEGGSIAGSARACDTA
jgi:hypothetical protein